MTKIDFVEFQQAAIVKFNLLFPIILIFIWKDKL